MTRTRRVNVAMVMKAKEILYRNLCTCLSISNFPAKFSDRWTKAGHRDLHCRDQKLQKMRERERERGCRIADRWS